jgi:hypothetical protein
MRAPNSAATVMARGNKQHRRHIGLAGTFSGEQWHKIDQTLIAPGLHDKIQDLAIEYGLRSRLRYTHVPDREPTPKQQAAGLRDEIATLDAALDLLNEYATRYAVGLIDADLDRDETRRAARALHGAIEPLKAARDKARQRLNEPSRTRGRRLGPGRTGKLKPHVYTEYLTQLAALWKDAVADASMRHKHQHLQNFLRACTEPVFPTVSDKALASFTERYFRRTAS